MCQPRGSPQYSCELIRSYIERMKNLTLAEGRQASPPSMRRTKELDNKLPFIFLRDCLAECPDEFPSASTSDLAFLANQSKVRDRLRMDMSSVEQALGNGEWKAATVLAGSVIEALLLWAIKQQSSGSIQTAIGLIPSKQQPAKSALDEGRLYDFVNVAKALGLISDATATLCDLARDFRNLIHPGLAISVDQECNRGTARTAAAAIDHVVSEFEKSAWP